jgi:NlpC/P60 family putative phage cell wall peptidase
MTTDRERVVAEAQKWLGTPFHHEARLLGVGVDCLQLLIAVYQGAGIIKGVPDERYTRDWHMHKSEERYLAGVERFFVKTEEALQGNAALFRFGRCISHAAIIIEWPLVIHAYWRGGVIASSVYDAELTGRLAGIWTWDAE